MALYIAIIQINNALFNNNTGILQMDRQTDTTPTLNNSIGMTFPKERTVNKIVTIVALD